jgi:hypothetical protein
LLDFPVDLLQGGIGDGERDPLPVAPGTDLETGREYKECRDPHDQKYLSLKIHTFGFSLG